MRGGGSCNDGAGQLSSSVTQHRFILFRSPSGSSRVSAFDVAIEISFLSIGLLAVQCPLCKGFLTSHQALAS